MGAAPARLQRLPLCPRAAPCSGLWARRGTAFGVVQRWVCVTGEGRSGGKAEEVGIAQGVCRFAVCLGMRLEVLEHRCLKILKAGLFPSLKARENVYAFCV